MFQSTLVEKLQLEIFGSLSGKKAQLAGLTICWLSSSTPQQPG